MVKSGVLAGTVAEGIAVQQESSEAEPASGVPMPLAPAEAKLAGSPEHGRPAMQWRRGFLDRPAGDERSRPKSVAESMALPRAQPAKERKAQCNRFEQQRATVISGPAGTVSQRKSPASRASLDYSRFDAATADEDSDMEAAESGQLQGDEAYRIAHRCAGVIEEIRASTPQREATPCIAPTGGSAATQAGNSGTVLEAMD